MKNSTETKFLKILLLVVVCVITLMISPAIHGQATGSFSGNVLDKSGSAIPEAAVVVTSQATGLVRDGTRFQLLRGLQTQSSECGIGLLMKSCGLWRKSQCIDILSRLS